MCHQNLIWQCSLSVLQLQVLGGPTISPCCMYPRLEPQKNTGNFEVLELPICWICPSLCSVVFLIGHLAGGNFPFWLFWIDWHRMLCQRSNKLYDGGWFRLKTACSAIKQSQFLPTRVFQGHFHTAFMKSELTLTCNQNVHNKEYFDIPCRCLKQSPFLWIWMTQPDGKFFGKAPVMEHQRRMNLQKLTQLLGSVQSCIFC